MRKSYQSYLALKYGVTLDQTTATDYIASDATTTMWSALDNVGYDHDIFGLGRDDVWGLDQKVSRSENPDSIITIALQEDFTSANTDAARTLAHTNDRQFLVLANDDGATTTQTTELDTDSYVERITREWKVDKSANFTQDINLSFEGFGRYTLLADTDGDFSSGATALGVLDGDGAITGISLDDGMHLTLARPALAFWLKADAGVTESGGAVSAWADQSGAAYDVTDAGTTPYDYITNTINYNPALQNSDGSNRQLTNADAIDLKTITVVTRPHNPASCDGVIGHLGDNGGAYNVRVCPDGTAWHIPGNNADFTYNGGLGWLNGLQATNPSHNNQPHILTVQAASLKSFTGGLEIGEFYLDRFWVGDVAEVIGYNTDLSNIERVASESYLALKYGITLDQSTATDYVAGDETTNVWDSTFAGSYNHDIAGIGTDTTSTLLQRISQSINDDALVTIASDADFTVSNPDTARTSLTDGSYLTWSNNDGGLAWTETGAPDGRSIITRTWLAQEVGSVGTIHIRVPDDGASESTTLPSERATIYLLIDDDDDFATAGGTAREVALTQSGDYWQGSVDLAHGEYFTFATREPNVAPTITSSAAITADENQTSVTTVTATDANTADALTYSITGGADQSLFAITASGVLTFVAAPDYESPTDTGDTAGNGTYEVEVTVTDDGIGTLSGTQTIIVTVADINDAPTDLSLSDTFVDENVANGTVVGTLAASDQDTADTHTYALSCATASADDASFAISGADLEIQVAPDHETQSAYSICVQVSDGTATYDKNFTISINDLNDAPTDIVLTPTSIDENIPATTVFATLSGSDDGENTGTQTFTLVSGTGDTDNATFTISGTDVAITESPDYETQPSYSIRVQLSDGSLTYEEVFTITILDLDEIAPVVTITTPSIVNALSSTSYTVSGTCTDGDGDVGVGIAGASPETQDVPCAGGTWSAAFDVSAISDGNAALTITADQTDIAGNTGAAPSAGADKDTVAPSTPSCTTTPEPANDGTAVTTVCTGVEEGATLTIPDMTCTPTPADATTTVTCTGTVGTGTDDVAVSDDVVTVTDSAGNTDTSATTGLTIDNTPPTDPATLTTPSTPTNNTTQNITGSCGADAANGSVTITTSPANGFAPYPSTTTLDTNGDFDLTGITWSEGAYDIILDCTDAAGNGPATTTVSPGVVIDVSAPESNITLSSPEGPTNDTAVSIIGQAGADAAGGTITITVEPQDGSTPYDLTAQIAADGAFMIDELTWQEGSYDLVVTITDPTGNATEETHLPSAVEIDVTAPLAPQITTPTTGAPVVGSGEPGATVVVTTPSGASCTTIVDPSGTWRCTLDPEPVDGESVTAVQTDQAGNASPATTIPEGINTSDRDGDGTPDAQEDIAPDGDGNGDGIQDADQTDVATTHNPDTEAHTTMTTTSSGDTACETISAYRVVPEAELSVQDTEYEYPLGLNDFTVRCAAPGGSTDVTFYYDDLYDTSAWVFRKYDDQGNVYADISDIVAYGTATVGGQTVTTATYTVTDGGDTDTDGVANSTIVDPAGPAVRASQEREGADLDEPDDVEVVCTPEGNHITWKDTSQGEDGFKIRREIGGVWDTIYRTSKNREAWTDTDVEVGRTYSYKIRAFEDDENTSYSDPVTCTVRGTPALTSLYNTVFDRSSSASDEKAEAGDVVSAETARDVATTDTPPAHDVRALAAETENAEDHVEVDPQVAQVQLGAEDTSDDHDICAGWPLWIWLILLVGVLLMVFVQYPFIAFVIGIITAALWFIAGCAPLWVLVVDALLVIAGWAIAHLGQRETEQSQQ